MKKYLLLFHFATAFCNAQILEYYPTGQEDYIGGNAQFYKDFNQVLKDKSMKPCENKNEIYKFRVVVYPDSTIKFVKEENPSVLVQNKCAFELTREVAKYLNGWKPAVFEGKKTPALTSFWIIPNDLFGNLKKDYDLVTEPAKYDGGMDNFRKKVFQSVNLSKFKVSETFKLTVNFTVEPDGKLSNLELAESSGLKEFDDRVINGISLIKNKWKPARINGIPVNYRFRLPLAFTTE